MPAKVSVYGKYLGRTVYTDNQDLCAVLASIGITCPAPITITSITLCLLVKPSCPANIPLQMTITATNGNNHILFCQSAIIALVFVTIVASQPLPAWTNCTTGPTMMALTSFSVTPYPLLIDLDVCATAVGILSSPIFRTRNTRHHGQIPWSNHLYGHSRLLHYRRRLLPCTRHDYQHHILCIS
ncbi:hypothetical protein BGZ92_007970 [Podila epicladia]|nr:hypothetical protein BGZ92_007970 [Podila epicladia]